MWYPVIVWSKFLSVRIIIRNVGRVSRAKSRICTWLGPSDKFQRNLAGRAIAFLLSPEWKSSKNEGTSRARTCLEKFRENVRGNPLSVTSLSFDFLSITCFSPLYDLARACDSGGQYERINTMSLQYDKIFITHGRYTTLCLWTTVTAFNSLSSGTLRKTTILIRSYRFFVKYSIRRLTPVHAL